MRRKMTMRKPVEKKAMKAMKKKRKATKKLLQTNADICDESDDPSAFGELTPEAVASLADAVGVNASFPSASFVDLGSGQGKLVLHMVLAGYAQQGTGVEL